jgi:hypothetical protein
MITDPLKSVVDFTFYRDVPKKSFGQVTGYIAYLGLIYSCVVVVALFVHFRPRINQAVDWASNSFPELTLENGELSSGANGRTLIRHPEADALAVMIDTDRSEAVTPAEMREQKLISYITRDTIYVIDNNNTMKVYDLSKAQNEKPVKIDDAFFKSLGLIMSAVLYPVSFVTAFLIFMIWKHLAALVYSLMALLINAAMGAGQEPPDLYKIAAYAQTPVIVLQMVGLVLLKPIPLFRVLAFLVVGAYLWQAIRQLKPADDSLEAV